MVRPPYLSLFHSFSRAKYIINSSTIITDILSYCAEGPGRTVAYYFFSFRDPEKQKIDNFLRSIIAQLICQMNNLPRCIMDLYEKYQAGSPPTKVLRQSLDSVLNLSGEAFVIIDALDECPIKDDERDKLCTLLSDISKSIMTPLHMLATSRKKADIESRFSKLPQMVPVPIQTSEVDGDILLYVNSQLETSRELSKRPAYIKAEISAKLSSQANGMYVILFKLE